MTCMQGGSRSQAIYLFANGSHSVYIIDDLPEPVLVGLLFAMECKWTANHVQWNLCGTGRV